MPDPTESEPVTRFSRRFAGIEELVPDPPALHHVLSSARVRRSRRQRIEMVASAVSLIVALAVTGALVRSMATGVGSVQPSATDLWPRVSINNETSVTVTVVLDGSVVGSIPPYTDQDPAPMALPALPWHFVLASPSGTTLLELNVSQSDYFDKQTGFGTTTDLACGYLSIRVGGGLPHGGPARSRATGSCD